MYFRKHTQEMSMSTKSLNIYVQDCIFAKLEIKSENVVGCFSTQVNLKSKHEISKGGSKCHMKTK